MFGNNPYAQGGWFNPANPQAVNQPSLWSSILGALPTIPTPPPTDSGVLSLEFTRCHPSILHASIIGPTGQVFLKLITGEHQTQFKKIDGQLVAYIDWSQRPTVSLAGHFNTMPISDWLVISPDRR